MKLNKEQIIKALKCCAKDDCDNCPNDFGNCYSNLAGYALAIIKELTEDNEWSAKRIIEADKKVAELTEENERLRAKGAEWRGCADKLFEEINKAKADTVRKMQNEINKTLSALCKGNVSEIRRIIDQIAKEMLEGENDR